MDTTKTEARTDDTKAAEAAETPGTTEATGTSEAPEAKKADGGPAAGAAVDEDAPDRKSVV